MKFKSSLVVLAFLLATSGLSYAQQTADQVAQALTGMKGAKWEDRSKAFDSAGQLLESEQLSHADADRLRVGIIQLLVRENNGGLKESESAGTGKGYGEDKSEYYAGLITFVSDRHGWSHP
ncbi:MAG TPA: hypothetical protein VH596_03180 [Terriglobales bacterium]|jgi:hypothetical protein